MAGEGERRAEPAFPELSLVGGGAAEIVDTDGGTVVLRATISSPPGSTLSGSAGGGRPFTVKVRGCKREEAGGGVTRFSIEGRFIDLTREQRALLAGAFPKVTGA